MNEADTNRTDDLRKELRKLQDEAAILRLLLKTPGWSVFQNFMQEQLKVRRDQVELSEVEGMDSMIKISHMNAELSGVRLGAEYVKITLAAWSDQEESLKNALKAYEAIEEEDKQDGN